MALHGEGRQAVGDHQRQVVATGVGFGVLAQALGRVVVQASAQVRALQVGVAVGRGAVQQQAVAAAFGQFGGEGGAVEGQVYGVAGLGVGELEVQLGFGGQAGAGAAEGDARGVRRRSSRQGLSRAGRLSWVIEGSSAELRQGLAEGGRQLLAQAHAAVLLVGDAHAFQPGLEFGAGRRPRLWRA